MLYMFTCLIAMVAFKEHESFNGLKHFVIPLFGLIANLVCMTFYLVGPFFVPGMSAKEPFIALGVCILFGGIGLVYFIINSKKRGVTVMVQARRGQWSAREAERDFTGRCAAHPDW